MINIAIDGPAGAGKSTIAKAVAKDLGIIYLDTGAMYRATAYTALEKGIDVTDADAVGEMLKDFKLDIVFDNDVQQIYVNGINTTPYLREHRMSKAASDISALPVVRYKIVDLEREFAKTHDVVIDGRDTGTFVLPDANCKFYMTASAEERANRRFIELKEKGQEVDYNQLLQDIIQRDYNDSHREVAPLKQAEDAYFLDTTSMTIDEVINKVKEIVDSKKKPSEETAVVNGKELHVDQETGLIEKEPVKDRTKRFKQEKSFRLYRFLRVLLKPVAAILLPTKIINKENAYKVTGGQYILNHYTSLDSVVPYCSIFKKEVHVIAKYELFQNSLMGWLLTKMGGIPVRRGDADIEAAKNCLRVLKDGKKLLIFPEGTRNKEGTQVMGEIKTGTARFAIKTKTPIVPMLYYQPPKPFRKNYLYIGEPFTLEEYYSAKKPEEFHEATKIIVEEFAECRKAVNEYVDSKKNRKKDK
ncbi:MAG: (d)CMP kinase [Clostridia bacterium]|nr:(d)CMP kinase [Clostridia bacterium]